MVAVPAHLWLVVGTRLHYGTAKRLAHMSSRRGRVSSSPPDRRASVYRQTILTAAAARGAGAAGAAGRHTTGTHGDRAGSCVCRLGRADFGAPHLGRHRGTDDTNRETRATATQERNGQQTAAAPAPERKPKRNCKPKQTDDRTKPPTADQTCGWRRGAYGMLLTG